MSYSDLTIYRTLLRRLRPYGLHIFAIFLLGLLATPLTLLGPLPLALAVDSVIGEKPPPAFLAPFLPSSPSGTEEPLLLIAAGLIVIVALLSNLQTLASSFLGAYAGERLVLDFRTQLFSHVQRLSLSYHDSKSTADSIYRIQNDGSAIRYIAIDGLIPFITSTLTFVSMLYISFRLDWQLALVALAVSPILFVVIRTYRLQLRNQSRKLKVLESDTMSVVQEVLTAVRVVKAFGQEDREKDRFVNHARAGMHARIQVSLAEGFLSLLLGLVIAIGTATVLFVGVRNVQSSKLSLGELLLVMAYVSQLYRPLKTMSKQVSNLQAHMASAERALSILHESPDVVERAGARSVSRANGDIVFQNVCFAYDERFRVLHDFSFEVSRSTRVGIIGETGIGKTTLLNLITRFHDPTAGRILLDGVDLRDYKLSALRRQFAIVLQDPVLFSSSIAENIAYANPKASENEITEAARAANAHEFVMGLPNGYETEVGERGVRLSGGERQRIALARAFLKDAPILLLDEPTSSIDPGTEGIILQALERLVDGRTCFIVAHRPHTLVNCDLVLEVKSRQVDNAGSVRTITVIQPVTPSKLMKSIPEVKVST